MRETGPSRTAMAVAIHRAAHQTIDQPPVFADPLAVRIIGPRGRAAMARHGRRRTSFMMVLRSVLAVRARVAEESLAEAVKAGVRQYVVLGAGLDTFGLRNTDPSLTVFEVDHPNTQTWKRRRVDEEGLVVPPTLRFVPVDFNRDELATALTSAGFQRDRPAFFSWLGVVPYLDSEAIRTTLHTVASLAGSTGGIALDFIAPAGRWQLLVRFILWLRGRHVARLGEPFHAPIPPADMEHWLREAGFADVTILSPHALTDRYLRGRRLRLSPVSFMAVARGQAAASSRLREPPSHAGARDSAER